MTLKADRVCVTYPLKPDLSLGKMGSCVFVLGRRAFNREAWLNMKKIAS